MQRWTALGFFVLIAGTLALVVAKGGPQAAPPPRAAAADAGAQAPSDAGATADPTDADAPAVDDPLAPGGDLNPATSDAGATLLNGEPAPALAGDAPKAVVFGVILVQYKGSQGAPPTARSHDDALQLAKDLATEAKQDFKATVGKGDKGSMENAGRMPRNMFEPAPEYMLFSLPKDGVSDPVDTPRGFLIFHRIE